MDSLVTPSASSASASASASARASLRSETTNHPRKVRSACNRCYRQKLRCVKITGELDCERCSKLHTSCQYGLRAPRASLKTPVPGIWHERHSVPAFLSAPDANLDTVLTDESNSEWLLAPDVSAGADIAEDQGLCYPMREDDLDLDNLYTNLSCESEVTNSLTQSGSPKMDLINQRQIHALFPPADSDNCLRVDNLDFNDHLEVSPGAVIRKLANLNVALYECSVNLPSMPKAGVNPAENISRGSESQKTKFFAIDELFSLTSEFIDLIKYFSFYTRDIQSSRDQSTQTLPEMRYMQQLSHSSQSTAAPSLSFSHVDEGTALMIMSCHCRLTETYRSIFHMMQACIESSTVPQIDKDAAIIFPRLQVGYHAAPQVKVDVNTALEPGTSRMYMLLVTMVAGQLCEKLTDVMTVRSEIPTESASASQRLFAATVTERTDLLERDIDATKHLLQRFSLG